MPFLQEDNWITSQAVPHDLAELEDCSIAIDATYWLSQVLDSPTGSEPLLPALGGLTGLEAHINEELDQWEKHRMIPFFIFDGQSLTGQDEVTLRRGQAAAQKTNEAWELYFDSKATEAVDTFGRYPGAYRIQNLYPMFQRILKARGLHFLVPPYNACAQLAYFEMVDSDQCAGVMGSQELLAYPIKDSIIRSIDWSKKTVSAISKKAIMRALGVSESMLIDALLMTGTSFINTFPPLLDRKIYPDYETQASISDSVNLLRTSEKSVATACASFNDILQAKDPDWLDKYRKTRMELQHFIHIAENGEVRVNDYEHLTADNHEYLGLQLPAELFHYLNTGLIGPRILSCITRGQMLIQPTLDGTPSEEYKKLVTSQLIPIKEQTLGLIVPRVHRGIGHKAITMRVWFDPKFSYTMNHSALSPPPSQKVGSWDVKKEDFEEFYPVEFAGPVNMEVITLAKSEFVSKTFAQDKPIRGIDSAEMITRVAIWRFLHLRGYTDDSHALTPLGNALGATFIALNEAMEGRPETPSGINEAALLAFELVRFGLLNGKIREPHPGYSRKGSDEEKASLALISECASLLKLRHQIIGYTGALNRSLLSFRSLSTTVREADRDLLEAIVASMFMYGQSRRDRDDQFEINQRLPFSQEPDISMGIAVRTFFDDDELSHTKEERAARLEQFPQTFVPYAQALTDDFRICVDFFRALNAGVQVLSNDVLSAEDKAAWARAQAYLDAKPF